MRRDTAFAVSRPPGARRTPRMTHSGRRRCGRCVVAGTPLRGPRRKARVVPWRYVPCTSRHAMTHALPKVIDADVPSVTTSDRRVQAEIVVARRYLGHGFVDAAVRIFSRRAANVTAADWQQLVA